MGRTRSADAAYRRRIRAALDSEAPRTMCPWCCEWFRSEGAHEDRCRVRLLEQRIIR